ncbi:MAG: hypothetical protein IPH01_02630 [Elusimicrobia bacterium]|nr:hypothetical protein [Elusimicrobiota bacterium]MBK8126208.1 hypothetical protein [Elusimicrobiota bacterium]MBK9056569.1 hypothetical protein [Elusimicrobiota bacterium]MBL0359620.1 hypothetical protein [Elusimicrobiota bacterium]
MRSWVLAPLLVLASPGVSRAEMFADVLGGGLNTGRASVDWVEETNGVPTASGSLQTTLKKGTLVGFRAGGWVETAPNFGLGMELSHGKLEGEGVEALVLPLSFFVAGRARLFANAKYPHGRLQPYALGGLSITFTRLQLDSSALGWSGMAGDDYGEKPPTGAYFALGAAGALTPNLFLFAEVRPGTLSGEDDEVLSYIFPSIHRRIDFSFHATRWVVGISRRFTVPTGGRPAVPAAPPSPAPPPSTEELRF